MPYVVVYKNRENGNILFLGQPGVGIHAGINTSYTTVIDVENARRFLTMRAAKPFTECNRNWECAVKRVEV